MNYNLAYYEERIRNVKTEDGFVALLLVNGLSLIGKASSIDAVTLQKPVGFQVIPDGRVQLFPVFACDPSDSVQVFPNTVVSVYRPDSNVVSAYQKIIGEYDSYGDNNHWYNKQIEQVFPKQITKTIYE